MRFTTITLAAGALTLASVGLAPSALAVDATREANCTAIRGTFVNGSNDSGDRCNVVSETTRTINGTTTTSTEYLVPVGEVYLGEGTFEPQLDDATTTTDTVYGEWAVTSVANGAAIPGTCTTTGKNRGSVQKCQYEKITTEQRTNTVTTTTTTPVLEITQVLQDTETVVTNTTPTTIRTTTTTVSHRFRTGGASADTIAANPAPTTTSVDTNTEGDPIVVENSTPDEEPQVVDTIIEEAPPIVEETTDTVTETQTTITPTNCKNNKSRSSDRENACPNS
jgi:hypothetical protein